MSQGFARKILNPLGLSTDEHLLNELRVIAKYGSHKRDWIVQILAFGKLQNSASYYIDLEHCDMSLRHFIYRKWTPEMEARLPYLTADSGRRTSTAHVWNIMEDTSNGLAYIHGLNEIHLDLRPTNSIVFSNVPANDSFILAEDAHLEDRGIWAHQIGALEYIVDRHERRYGSLL